MGSVCSKPENGTNQHRNTADHGVSELAAHPIKILLLGGPESGKTTIFKQMRILHLDGFSKHDLINYRFVVQSNAVEVLENVVERVRLEHVNLDTSVEESVETFETFCTESAPAHGYALDSDIGHTMASIWQAAAIQEIFEIKWQYCFPEYTKHYLDNIPRISESDYTPSVDDILLSRVRTVGISELDFSLDFKLKNLAVKILDVGGQKTERRKWIHCFDDVDLLIFVAGLSDFDKISDENPKLNRLEENIQIFDAVINNPLFQKTSVVLFLNKKDTFEEKLNYSILSNWYPKYQGPNSYAECCEFIEHRFRSRVKSEVARQKLIVYQTTATDTNNINVVFSAAVDHVMNQAIHKGGFM